MLPDGATLPSFDLAFARLAIAAPLLVLFSGLFLGRALWANAARRAHSLSRKLPGSMTTAKAVAYVPSNRLLQRCR
jgi:hypothetical protein